jgi:hypothetical protein
MMPYYQTYQKRQFIIFRPSKQWRGRYRFTSPAKKAGDFLCKNTSKNILTFFRFSEGANYTTGSGVRSGGAMSSRREITKGAKIRVFSECLGTVDSLFSLDSVKPWQ